MKTFGIKLLTLTEWKLRIELFAGIKFNSLVNRIFLSICPAPFSWGTEVSAVKRWPDRTLVYFLCTRLVCTNHSNHHDFPRWWTNFKFLYVLWNFEMPFGYEQHVFDSQFRKRFAGTRSIPSGFAISRCSTRLLYNLIDACSAFTCRFCLQSSVFKNQSWHGVSTKRCRFLSVFIITETTTARAVREVCVSKKKRLWKRIRSRS